MSISDIKDLLTFITTHWEAVVVTIVVTSPIIYKISSSRHRRQVEHAETKAKNALEEILRLKDAPRVDRDNELHFFPRVTPESEDDLITRLEGARRIIRIFGLTRNFYARSERLQNLIIKKAQEVPVRIYIMEPDCPSRADRYRVEPFGAAMYDPEHFKETIVPVFRSMLKRADSASPSKPNAGLSFHYFNFPCQFAVEQCDDTCRVSIYGLNQQGSESPIWVYEKTRRGGREFEYFVSQLDWVEKLAGGMTSVEIQKKNLGVQPLT